MLILLLTRASIFMNCHFAYSVPPGHTDIITRTRRKIRRILNSKGFPVDVVTNRKPSLAELEQWPIQSPYENTKHIYLALKELMPTYLYDLSEKVDCKFLPEDIFIGHPYFPHKDGAFGVTEMAFRSVIRPRMTALIAPLHCNTIIETSHINKAFLDDVDALMPRVDLLFAIMGQYWWDQWETSPYAHWKPKMVRLDMAVDVAHYPRIKSQFNKAGKRGYLFIGSSWDKRKGSDYFADLMARCGGAPCGWIGDGPEIPGVPRISGQRALTPEFMTGIAKRYDFFVSTARADPNPTTILESMAWGFPVVCTPQSGYYETDYRANISLTDLDSSIKTLNELQKAPEDHLLNMADSARKVVESEYTWEKFCMAVTERI